MSNLHSLSIHSWSDVYQRLRAKAEASRGMVALYASATPGATFPHTTSRDAFAIALVFDAAVNDHASRALVARWLGESDLLAGEPEGSTETYVGNRSFWETLAAAAIELDRVHAPLPALSLIDDAMRELDTARPAAQQAHPAAETMLVTVLTEPSFQAMATRQFEFFRMLRGEGVGEGPSMPLVPVTCNADVLALADYWTDQLARVGANASDTYCRLVYSCWRDVLHRALRHAKHAPAFDTYVHNTEFWNALLLLTTQSDVRDASPTPWAFQVPRFGHPHGHHRNAPAVDIGATLDVSAAKTADDVARMQRDAFSKLRGEDRVTGRFIGRVPRTTIADVRQLAAYWSNALDMVGEHNFADISYKSRVQRWKDAVAEVKRISPSTDPASVYEHNADFWEAVLTISIQVAVTARAPTRWTLVKETAAQAIAKLPDTLTELPHTLKTAVNDLASGVLAKPLLYVGAGLGGLALAILLLRRSVKRETKS
jgi:hypothetical protein